MWPILQRELRAEARRPVTYWLRAGIAGVFFVLLEMSLHSLGSVEAICRGLFPILHALMLVVSWLVAPLLIIEAIAREKRERTLELLLLTPLTLNAVLHAKTADCTARTLVLVVGGLPVIAFTVLFGGVGREELILLLLLQATSVVASLTIGLFAAAWGRTWIQSLALAGVLLTGVASAMALLLFAGFQRVVGDTFAAELWPPPTSIAGWISGAVRLVGDADGIWSQTIGTIPRVLIDGWLWLFGIIFLLAVLLAVLLGAGARTVLRRSLRLEPVRRLSLARLRAWRPIGLSNRRRRRWLRGNPVRWLMRYPWEVRFFRWAGAGVVAAGQLAVWRFSLPFSTWFSLQMAIALALGLLLVMAAAASFHREREEGGLEMLMVTPLTAGKLLTGRVAGMWWQFGPTFLTWATTLMVFSPDPRRADAVIALAIWVTALFLTVPAIGLEAAFQFRTYWKAVGATMFGSVGISGLLLWLGFIENAAGFYCAVGIAVLLVVAGLCGPGFQLRLELRRNGENLRPSRPLRWGRHRFRRVKGIKRAAAARVLS